jgi:SAM-dependent methyltransferase
MEHLRLPEGQVFVDFGCGKGRVLLAAAAYPFRRIVGIEFSPELCTICRRNISSFRQRYRSHIEIDVIQSDATKYNIGHDESVFFFFNPFECGLMKEVLHNIQSSAEISPRKIWIIVNKPHEHAPAFDAIGGLHWLGEYVYGSSVFWMWSGGAEPPKSESQESTYMR